MTEAERLGITASGALLFIVSIYIFNDLLGMMSNQGISGLEAVISAVVIEVVLGAAAGIGMYYAVMKKLEDVVGLLRKTRVSDVYIPLKITLSTEAGPTEAQKAVKGSPVRAVAVTDGEGGLVGVLSDYDLSFKSGERVGDLMTPNPSAVNLNSSLLEAYIVMKTLGLNKLPVYEERDGKRIYKGFITMGQIVEKLVGS